MTMPETNAGYAAGLTVGRTPLIKLSPKKTWEGFIGGAVVTLVASWYLAGFMSRYKWMTCERNVRARPPCLCAGFSGLICSRCVLLVVVAQWPTMRADL